MKSEPKFKILRPSSLQFLLRYGGATNAEMMERIRVATKGRRQVTGYAQYVIDRVSHEPAEKDALIVAPLLSEWFGEPPTTAAIYAKAQSLGLLNLHPSAAFCIAERYDEQPREGRILIGHTPVPVSNLPGRSLILSVEDSFNDGHLLNAADASNAADEEEREWCLGFRFAFEDPAMAA